MNRYAGIAVGVLILVSLAGQLWSRWFTSDDVPESVPDAAPAARSVAAADWLGTWVSGDAVIRFRHDGRLKGDYSPDGESVIPFVAQLRGDAVTFKARIQGRACSLWLTRVGESAARLAGVQEVEPRTGPVVIAPGRTPQEQAEAAAQRRAETRRVLLPSDLGTFQRVQ
jgi:hypothetical protein